MGDIAKLRPLVKALGGWPKLLALLDWMAKELKTLQTKVKQEVKDNAS